MKTYDIGDKVNVSPEFDTGKFRGVIFTVAKLPTGARGVNYSLTRDGGGQGLRASADQLVPAGEIPTMVPREPITYYISGQVVRVDTDAMARGHRIPTGELFVVQNDQGKDTVSIVRLGGHPDGRYWRLPRGAIVSVPVAEIGERMAAHIAVVESGH
jgi:hypothetical protein